MPRPKPNGYSHSITKCFKQCTGKAVAAQDGTIALAEIPDQAIVPAGTYRIMHRTAGRIRLKIARLSTDAPYAADLRSQIESWSGVTEVRLNAAAASISIQYETRQISDAVLEQKLLAVIDQID